MSRSVEDVDQDLRVVAVVRAACVGEGGPGRRPQRTRRRHDAPLGRPACPPKQTAPRELTHAQDPDEVVEFARTAMCSVNCGPDPLFDSMDPLYELKPAWLNVSPELSGDHGRSSLVWLPG